MGHRGPVTSSQAPHSGTPKGSKLLESFANGKRVAKETVPLLIFKSFLAEFAGEFPLQIRNKKGHSPCDPSTSSQFSATEGKVNKLTGLKANFRRVGVFRSLN